VRSFDFSAEHWSTSNTIESAVATVRLRQRVTKGTARGRNGLAQGRWRQLDGAHLLPLVRAGIAFVDGVQQVKARQAQKPSRVAHPSRLPISGVRFHRALIPHHDDG
jgi:hypothetical protein